MDDPCHPVGTPDSSFARDADLARPRANPHVPHHQETVLSCLRTILEEGWEHLRYATRDLEAGGARSRRMGLGTPHTPLTGGDAHSSTRGSIASSPLTADRVAGRIGFTPLSSALAAAVVLSPASRPSSA